MGAKVWIDSRIVVIWAGLLLLFAVAGVLYSRLKDRDSKEMSNLQQLERHTQLSGVVGRMKDNLVLMGKLKNSAQADVRLTRMPGGFMKLAGADNKNATATWSTVYINDKLIEIDMKEISRTKLLRQEESRKIEALYQMYQKLFKLALRQDSLAMSGTASWDDMFLQFGKAADAAVAGGKNVAAPLSDNGASSAMLDACNSCAAVSGQLINGGLSYRAVESLFGIPQGKERSRVDGEVWFYPSCKPDFRTSLYFRDGRARQCKIMPVSR